MGYQPDVNYLAVLVAAVASMALGFLWYGPFFGKPWMQLMGIDPKKIKASAKKGMQKTYMLAFLGSLVSIFVLAHFVDYLGVADLSGAITLGTWLWLGFVAPVQLGSVLWEQKPWKLFWINTLYHLVSLCISATILGLMG